MLLAVISSFVVFSVEIVIIGDDFCYRNQIFLSYMNSSCLWPSNKISSLGLATVRPVWAKCKKHRKIEVSHVSTLNENISHLLRLWYFGSDDWKQAAWQNSVRLPNFQELGISQNECRRNFNLKFFHVHPPTLRQRHESVVHPKKVDKRAYPKRAMRDDSFDEKWKNLISVSFQFFMLGA